MRHPLLAALAILCPVLFLAACGKDSPNTPGEPGSREEAKKDKGHLEKTVGAVDRARDLECKNHLITFGRELSINAKEMLRGKTLAGTDVAFILMESSTTIKDPAYLYCINVHPQNTRPSDQQVGLRDPNATDYEGPANFQVPGTIFGQANRFPILWDKHGNHEGYRFVLFLDGQVREVANKDFQAQVLDVVDSFRQGG